MSVIYDTGSSWLTLETDFCTNCIPHVYNTTESTTYNRTTNSISNQSYGSAFLEGYEATDSVSVNEAVVPKVRLSSFGFFAISA